MQPPIFFDNVSKKFRRGERHDSLRDLVPSLIRRAVRRPADLLESQEFWALRNVSFAVEAGRALGIIGGNGAGKSTSLKLLTRILRPTSGFCALRGRVGALIEVAAGFHPDLTGRENIYLQGAIMGMTRAETTDRLDEIIDFAGVDAFIDTPVKRYSSGMNARLGFAIAAHLRPDVLVIDEVLSVGDVAFQQKCVDRMMRFKREGVAIVFVSHNLQAVTALCETAIHLKREVLASGPTSDVLRHYLETSAKPVEQSDGPAAIQWASLLTPDGAPVETAQAGDPLVLRVSYRIPSEGLELLCFGVLVRRSTDNLVVYDANWVPDEIVPTSAHRTPDGLLEFIVDYHLSMNLTRGHYRFECHVQHTPTQGFVAQLSPAAHVSVSETRTCAGIADLAFQAVPAGADLRAKGA